MNNNRNIRNIFLITLGAAIVIGYIFLNTSAIRKGPEITLTSVQNGQSFFKPLFELEGIAENTVRLTVNGTRVDLEADGKFHQTLLLLPGYNNMTVQAEDKFGKITTEQLSFLYDEVVTAPTAPSRGSTKVAVPPTTSITPPLASDITETDATETINE